jgi:hypothetical protein
LDGITAQQYLEKAKALFKEMDLRWDLEELAKITNDTEFQGIDSALPV